MAGKNGGLRPGAGRPVGALTKRSRIIAEKLAADGKTPLEIMTDNMRHWHQAAMDAEATLAGLTASEMSAQVGEDASPEEQFKFLLAKAKETAGFRQLAQDAARDAAPYVHPKLAAVEHTGKDGGPIKMVSKIELVAAEVSHDDGQA